MNEQSPPNPEADSRPHWFFIGNKQKILHFLGRKKSAVFQVKKQKSVMDYQDLFWSELDCQIFLYGLCGKLLVEPPLRIRETVLQIQKYIKGNNSQTTVAAH